MRRRDQIVVLERELDAAYALQEQQARDTAELTRRLENVKNAHSDLLKRYWAQSERVADLEFRVGDRAALEEELQSKSAMLAAEREEVLARTREAESLRAELESVKAYTEQYRRDCADTVPGDEQ